MVEISNYCKINFFIATQQKDFENITRGAAEKLQIRVQVQTAIKYAPESRCTLYVVPGPAGAEKHVQTQHFQASSHCRLKFINLGHWPFQFS